MNNSKPLNNNTTYIFFLGLNSSRENPIVKLSKIPHADKALKTHVNKESIIGSI